MALNAVRGRSAGAVLPFICVLVASFFATGAAEYRKPIPADNVNGVYTYRRNTRCASIGTGAPDTATAPCCGEDIHTIKIASDVQFINASSFSWCASVTSVNFANASSLLAIGSDAFAGTNIEVIDLSGATALKYLGRWSLKDIVKINKLVLPPNLGSRKDNDYVNTWGESNCSLVDELQGICTLCETRGPLCPAEDCKTCGTPIHKQAMVGSPIEPHQVDLNGYDCRRPSSVSGLFPFVDGLLAFGTFACPYIYTSAVTCCGVTPTTLTDCCTGRDAIVIDESVISIIDFAFTGCSKVRSISFHRATNLQTIDRFAFSNLDWDGDVTKDLMHIDMSFAINLTEIGKGAFSQSVSERPFAVKLTLPPNLATLENRAFKKMFIDDDASMVDWNGHDCAVLCQNLAGNVAGTGRRSSFPFDFHCPYTYTPNTTCMNDGGTSEYNCCRYPQLGDQPFGNSSGLTATGPLPPTVLLIQRDVLHIKPSAFSACAGITKVIFEKGSQLQTIGDRSFEKLLNLNAVDLSEASQLTTIGSKAFHLTGTNRPEAMELTLVDSLNFVAHDAFAKFSKQDIAPIIKWNGVICNLVFENTSSYMTQSVSSNPPLPGIPMRCPDQTCKQNFLEGTCVFTSSATCTVSAEDSCCAGDATTVVIGPTLTEVFPSFLGVSACNGVTKVIFRWAEKLKRIRDFAFNGTAITSVDMSGALVLAQIDESAFAIPTLMSVVLASGKSFSFLEGDAFTGSKLLHPSQFVWNGADCSEMSMPRGGANPFMFACPPQTCNATNTEDTCVLRKAESDCTSVLGVSCCAGVATVIRISHTVAVIPDHAFLGCTGVHTIVLAPYKRRPLSSPSLAAYMDATHALRRIGKRAFEGNTALLALDLSGLDNDPFGTLETATHMSRLAQIDEAAFKGCTMLRSLVLVESIDFLGNNAFHNTGLNTTSSVTWNGMDCVAVALRSCGAPTTIQECNLPFVCPDLACGPNASYDTCIVQPTQLPMSTFDVGWITLTMKNLMDFGTGGALPFTISEINRTWVPPFNKDSFRPSVVVVPEDVKTIGPLAFGGASSISSIEHLFFRRATSLRSIEMAAFVETKIAVLDLRGAAKLRSIAAWAFIGNDKLKYIAFPPSLTYLGDQAFADPKNEHSFKADGNLSISQILFNGVDCVGSTRNLSNQSEWNAFDMIFGPYDVEPLVQKQHCPKQACNVNNIDDTCVVRAGASAQPTVASSGNHEAAQDQWSSHDGHPYYDQMIAAAPCEQSIEEITCLNICASNAACDVFVHDSTMRCCIFTLLQEWDSLTWDNSSIPVQSQSFLKPKSCSAGAATSVVISRGVHSIAQSAFGDSACPRIAQLVVAPEHHHLKGSQLKEIAANAFEGTNITSLDLSRASNMQAIGTSAFASCPSLSSIVFPASLTKINASAFRGAGVITSVDLSEAPALHTVGSYAFEGCSALSSLMVSPGLQNVGMGAFLGTSLHAETDVTWGAVQCYDIAGEAHSRFNFTCSDSIVRVTALSATDVAFEGDTANPLTVLTVDVAAVEVMTSGESIHIECESLPHGWLIPSPVELDIAAGVVITDGKLVGVPSSIAVTATPDVAQLEARSAILRCVESSTTRSTQVHNISVTIGGVAQPSIGTICQLTTAEDTALTGTSDLPARCVDSVGSITTNGNTSLLIVGGTCASCPQPPFFIKIQGAPPTTGTTVKIAGLDVATTVVPGSGGTRLRARIPSIKEISADLSAFIYDYYDLDVTTAATSTTTRNGSIALGPTKVTPPPMCPAVSSALAGIYYTQHCLGYRDPTTDTGWMVEETADSFAYSRPPRCQACPEGCLCPGGDRCRAASGYFSDSEALGEGFGEVAKLPRKCAAPSLSRCVGWSDISGTTACGAGYAGVGCGYCKKDHYTALGGVCEPCATAGILEAFTVPLIANIILFATVFPILCLIKFLFLFVSARADPEDDRGFFAIGKDSVLQTASFASSFFGAVQMVASVTNAAAGKSSNLMQKMNSALAVFLFEPPFVEPECVDDEFSLGFTKEYSILIGGIVFVAADLALMAISRSIRTSAASGAGEDGEAGIPVDADEEKKFALVKDATTATATADGAAAVGFATDGGRGTSGSGDAPEKNATPIALVILAFGRFGISSVLCVAYAKIVTIATAMLACTASAALDNTLGLRSDPTKACFDAAHTPVFVLAVLALVFVGIVWPVVWMASLSTEFVCRTGGDAKDAQPLAEADAAAAAGAILGDNHTGRKEAVETALLEYAVELGCTARRCTPRVPTRVKLRFAAKGIRARGVFAFLDTPFEPQFFWLVGLRFATMLALATINACFADATPTLSSAIALFTLTNLVMVAYTVGTILPCPYHRADRWNIVERVALCVLTFLASATNLCLALDELRVDSALAVAEVTATMSAILLPACFAAVLIAFLLSRGLGLCALLGCRCEFFRSPATRDDAALDALLEADAREREAGGEGDTVLDAFFDDDGRMLQKEPSLRGGAGGSGNRSSSVQIELGANPMQTAAERRRSTRTGRMPTIGPQADENAVAASSAATRANPLIDTTRRASAVSKPDYASLFSRSSVTGGGGNIIGEDAALVGGRSTTLLPPRWSSHESDGGHTYYHNALTGETAWTIPPGAAIEEQSADILKLKSAWVSHVDEATGHTYYYNPVTGESTYDHPGWKSDGDDGEDEGGALSTTMTASATTPRIQSGPNSLELHDAEQRRAVGSGKQFVRWKWTKRDAVSLADGLLGRGGGGSGGECPSYMATLFNAIFTDSDTDGDGSLSTLELMHMLRRRATGTALDGDAHAIFTLRTILAKQCISTDADDDTEEIGPREFRNGLVEAMRVDPDGNVAQWVLKELFEAAAAWEEKIHEGRVFFVHKPSGASSWERPEILIEMDRCAGVLAPCSRDV